MRVRPDPTCRSHERLPQIDGTDSVCPAAATGPAHLQIWQERLANPCFVYVVRGEGSEAIKIGKAKDVRRRLSQLQVGNPATLELLHVIPTDTARNAIRLEQNLHARGDQDLVRGEWFSGPSADLVLLIVAGLAEQMVEVHDGSRFPPSVWSILPPPTVVWEGDEYWVLDNEPEWSLTDDQREVRDAADEEYGIAILGEEHWPRIADMYMNSDPLAEIALELDVTEGRLRRTMDAMRDGGYALAPGARRTRDPYGHESSRRWVRAS